MSEKLTPRKIRTIKALLDHPTIEKAATAARVNPRTIYRWMDDELFRGELLAAESELIDLATRRLVKMAAMALDALESVLNIPSQDGAGNKRLAAQAILENLMKLREFRNLEQRLADLEAAVYGKEN